LNTLLLETVRLLGSEPLLLVAVTLFGLETETLVLLLLVAEFAVSLLLEIKSLSSNLLRLFALFLLV